MGKKVHEIFLMLYIDIVQGKWNYVDTKSR